MRILCSYILLCAVFLSGCILSEKIDKDTVLKEIRPVTESSLPFENSIQDTFESRDAFKAKKSIEEEKEVQTKSGNNRELTDDLKAEIMRKQQDLYYFSHMEIIEQNLYVEMLYALENYIEEMELSVTDTKQIDYVFQCVLMDHPEIFYADGYSFVKYTLGDEVKKITFKGTYIYEQEEKVRKEAQIQEAVYNMLRGIRADATDYEKVKYVYETIINQTEYDMNSEDNQNICSVFLGRVSVCQGYAKAAQFLLDKLNVPCTLVIGTVETGEGHAWNLVKINNQYYYMDTTWGDASYKLHVNEEEQQLQNVPGINYDYLCVTTEEILRTHSMANIVELPQCNSLEANYYVREGAYFTDVNFEQLVQLLTRYKEDARDTVTIKCSGDDVYQKMSEELLTKQKIFKYMDYGNNSIMYTDSPKQRSITFWL